MASIPQPPTFTPDDLLRMPDSVSYELVDGRLVERHSGMMASEIAVRVASLIGLFARDSRPGFVSNPDAGYQCFPDAPHKVRKADASFVRTGRFPGNRVPKGHSPIAPDLAVEVVAPGDLAYELDRKIDEYLAVGVPLVWVVWPASRTVMVYRQPSSPLGTASRLGATDTITGEDVLPGFSCGVKEFFE